jgi:hypothetical protein
VANKTAKPLATVAKEILCLAEAQTTVLLVF